MHVRVLCSCLGLTNIDVLLSSGRSNCCCGCCMCSVSFFSSSNIVDCLCYISILYVLPYEAYQCYPFAFAKPLPLCPQLFILNFKLIFNIIYLLSVQSYLHANQLSVSIAVSGLNRMYMFILLFIGLCLCSCY